MARLACGSLRVDGHTAIGRIAALLGVCGAASVALAGQTFYTFIGSPDSDWNSALNWTPTGIPGSGLADVALIPAGSQARFGTVGPIGRTIDKIQIDATAQLEIRNDFDLSIRGQTDGLGTTGLLSIPGTLLMSSVGNATDLIIAGSGTYAVFGGGSPTTPALIQMSNSTQNRIYGGGGNERLDIQPAATIRGAGQIGLNALSIVNEGTIEAQGSNGITIDPNGSGLVNTGVLRAGNGPLTLLNGTFNNSDGEIIANESDVILVGADVSGGVLNTTGNGGSVRAGSVGGGAILHDLTNLGVFRSPNDLDMSAFGTIVNNGQMLMQSVGNATDIYLSSNLTFSGSGSVLMSNSQQNRIYDASGPRGNQLTNGGTHTISGSGQIGVNSINIVNQAGASILATSSSGLVLDPSESVTNLGTLGATEGGRLFLTGGTFIMTAPAIAQDGGIIFFSSGTFTGTFGTAGSGDCRIDAIGGSVLLTNLTNTGLLLFPNDRDALIENTITNNGTIAMQSVGNSTDMYINNNSVVFAGTGTISMSNSNQNRIFDASGNRGFGLTNATTISGSGQIGLNSISILNQASGVIAAVGSTGISIDPSTTLINNGVIRADTGSRIDFQTGTYTFNTPAVAMDGAAIGFNGGTYSGAIDTEGSGVCSVLSLGAATVFDGLINLGSMDHPNDRDALYVNTLDNRGTITLRSAGNATDFYVGSDLSIIGGGQIVTTNSNQNNFFDSSGNRGFTLTNVNNAISGAGRIGLNTINVVNQAAGSIIATSTSGYEIDPGATFTNNGTLRAESGSNLNLLSGTYQFNAPAVAGTGGVVFLTGGTFSGSIDTEGTGEVRANSNGQATQLSGLTNLGLLIMPNDRDMGVSGPVINQGTFEMRSQGNATDLYINTNLSLSGGGTLLMSNSNQNNIFDASGDRGFTFTNVDNVIAGSGRIGLNTIDLVNGPGGTIDATSSTGILIDTPRLVTNQGTMRASGGNIQFAAVPDCTNTGTLIADAGRLIQFTGTTFLQTGGFTIANGEVQVDNNIFNLEGGMVLGTGRVDSNVNNTDGVVSPGTSTSVDTPSFAVLTIEGDFNQSQTGETFIELGGPTAGTEYDRVAVTGVASTGGTLRIRLVDGYSPVLGTSYDIVTAASLANGYDSIVAENIPFNNQLNIQFLSDRIRVIFAIRCLGDYDGDGGVTGGDIAAFFEDFEAGAAAADLDQDGGITGGDIAEFFSRFEAGC